MPKTMSLKRDFLAAAILLTVLLVWVTAIQIAQAASFTYSGRATVVRAEVLGLESVMLSDTGPLASSGGAEHESLLHATLPGLLNADVLHAATVGQGNAARSDASVANLEMTVGGHSISAGFLMARAAAQCKGGTASISGGSEVAKLVVDGTSITVTTSPNQEVGLVDAAGVRVGHVVINEQNSFASGSFGQTTVNALHVEVFGVADVIISHAHADITCAGPTLGGDFITGGGWISGTPSGATANFGVAGGVKSGKFWGHLNYIDHGQRLHVKGTGVTAYEVIDETTRRIEGTAEVNGQAGFTYKVEVADNGEPGRSDTFSLRLSNGYAASGSLEGGNIQLHNDS